MKKDDFKKYRIAESIFQFSYAPVPDIIRLAYEFESGLNAIFENKVTLTNVPSNTTPDIPRFVLSSKLKRVLEVGPISAVFKSQPADLSSQEALKLYENKVTKVFNHLNKSKIIKLESFASQNVVQYPLVSLKNPIEKNILNEFTKIEEPKGYKGISLTIVQSEEGNYRFSYNIDIYETRNFNAKIEGKIVDLIEGLQVQRIPLSNYEVIERGLNIKIVINRDPTFDIDKNQNIEQTFRKALKLTLDRINNYSEHFLFGRSV